MDDEGRAFVVVSEATAFTEARSWRTPVRSSSVQATVQVAQALGQPFAVLLLRNAVDTGCSVLPQCEVGHLQRLWRNVTEERSETLLPVSLCSFPHPSAACGTLPAAAFGACFGNPDSPWLSPLLQRLRRNSRFFVPPPS